MMKIGLLSDTHGYIHPEIARIFAECDEIWHAGDFGNIQVADELQKIKPLRAVHGNIDDHRVRSVFPDLLRFQCQGVDVLITHIGGYPGRYAPRIREILKVNPPKLFISGHSHILKVMYDKKNDLLHINPGAAGRSGLHNVITMVRFLIDGAIIKDLEIIEFNRKTL